MALIFQGVSMRQTMRFLFILAGVLFSDYGFAGYQEGLNSYNKKDYVTAIKELQPLAKKGNAAAQLNLAQMYYYGWGVQKDYNVAMDWYRKSAIQGNSDALFGLSRMYEDGVGVAANRVIADALLHFWYKLDNYNKGTPYYGSSEGNYVKPLENKMSSKEIAAATKLLVEMKKPLNILNALDQYALHPTVKEDLIYSPVGGKESLCTDSEQILLTCLTKQRLISLCSTKVFSATTGYIQYRVERNGKIEFEFPKEKVQPNKVFTLGKTDGGSSGGGRITLGFKNGEYLYEVKHVTDKFSLDDYRVLVSRDQEVISSLPCAENVISDHWDELESSDLPEPRNQ
jgi:hypothetical protein